MTPLTPAGRVRDASRHTGTMPSTISRTDLLRLRIYAQGLSSPRPVEGGQEDSQHRLDVRASIDRVMGNQFALQGQDLPGTLWAIGVRAPGSTIEDVRGAFDSGMYLRSWPFRGTLFAMTAADLPWILAVTGPRIHAGAAARRTALGLDNDTINRARAAAVGQIRSGGGALRADMLAAFERARDVQLKKGFQLMFAQGAEAPK